MIFDRVEVCFLFIEADEHRYSDQIVRYRKSGKYDAELFPKALLDVKSYIGKESLEYLLAPCADAFTAKDFSLLHKLKGRPLYAALNLLCDLKLLCKTKTPSGAFEYSKIK